MQELVAELSSVVKEKVRVWLRARCLTEVASLTWVQELTTEVSRAVGLSVAQAWKGALVQLCQGVRECPQCGHQRRCTWRASHPLRVEVVGLCVELPKLYVECGHCDAPSLSIIKLLTGLAGGAVGLTAARPCRHPRGAEARR